MANGDRLTGLDASFLALESAGAHMHVGSVLILDGPAPSYEDFVAAIEGRLHLVPRYRQKLAFPPLGGARPVWVDDPHFNASYHVRHTALPPPAGGGGGQGARGRGGSTTPTSTRATTCATPLCRRRRGGRSSRRWPAASSPSSSIAPSRCGRSGWSSGSATTRSRWSARPITRWSTGSPASTS